MDAFETGIPGEHEARATANKSVKSPTPRAETFENPVGYVKEDCIGLHRVGKADTGKTVDRRSEARSTAVCMLGIARSEERRVGKECVRKGINGWSPGHEQKK